jgi:drug/metabolite transporter (DMT)-like permease
MTPQMTALASAAQRSIGLTSPFRYVFIAVTVGIVGWYWLGRQGPFRPAAQRGGWRLAVAVLSSLCMLVFGIGIAIGQLVIGIVALIVGGLPAMVLILNGKARTLKQ